MMRSLLLILLFVACNVGAAEETSRHRIVGLFETSRQDDLREAVKSIPDVELVSVDFATTEATFRFEVAKLISGYNAKKPPTDEAIAKRLDELLRTASQGTFTLKPLGTIPEDAMQKIEFRVGILDCRGCRYGVYLAVAKLDGVERATVSTEQNILTVWIDPGKTNRAALEEALKKGRVELPTP